jgi:hypothetical protein
MNRWLSKAVSLSTRATKVPMPVSQKAVSVEHALVRGDQDTEAWTVDEGDLGQVEVDDVAVGLGLLVEDLGERVTCG